MKNLELKFTGEGSNIDNMKDFYVETLIQKDTYYNTTRGRLKLRQEKGKESYVIYYERPDSEEEKISNYKFYPIENTQLFKEVFNNGLTKEIIVKKERKLYIYKNARIHFDNVKDLGNFIEIEVVMKPESDESDAKIVMDEILSLLNVQNLNVIKCGYRELLLKNNSLHKDLKYYSSQ